MESVYGFVYEKINTDSNDYPLSLKEIKDRPAQISILGNNDNLSKFKSLQSGILAVVGTRNVTDYGRKITASLVSQLVDMGVTIVSGIMYGVDEISHRTAVSQGGFTVGVWAGGIDTLFHTSREATARKILQSGVIISEYELGLKPQIWTFPARNRIVAGLSQAVLITEAAIASGSLITAGFAAEMGREVLAVPGPITSPLSQGVNHLIKSGAKMVSDIDDILPVLGIFTKRNLGSLRKLEDILCSAKTDQEKKLIKSLGNNHKDADSLIRETGMSAGEVSALLTQMELSGVVHMESGKYSLVF
jgi:DNA processing protein